MYHDCAKYHQKAVTHSIHGQVPVVRVYNTYLEGILEKKRVALISRCVQYQAVTPDRVNSQKKSHGVMVHFEKMYHNEMIPTCIVLICVSVIV